MDGRDTPLTQPQPGDVDGAMQVEKVGYGRPPVRTRYQPGRSGNPAGRPKGARNRSPAREVERARETALAEVYREVRATDGGRTIVITMLQAIWRAVIAKAAKGDFRSIKYVIDKAGEIEKEKAAQLVTNLKAAVEYQKRAYIEIERHEAAGAELLEIYPHPDDMRFDFDRGIVDIIGPREPEEREIWDQIDAIILMEDGTVAEIERLERTLEGSGLEPEEARSLCERLEIMKRVQKRLTNSNASMPPEDKAWRLRRLKKAGRGKA
ncbi:DUF5681 domain-containing protein [Methylobacterium sp. J-026]|uniref:DUF5681 domain-containing protein n=1 Tax=Methylobacterium sp. J-026 TaxID=2836624 RepID=UPI001FB9C667|nr:DUF5681 domain-containing protein [Methylobacterium sp. J-026]MCJ2135093.1 DUF5681 domain-containing protein [Methylobacterium sp. J-026]